MNRLLIVAAAVLLFCGAAFAQVAASKQISGGVVNGKATALPKPAYPPAARAVNAEGAVSVQVLIDENGSVVSATAISGHPLLRAAAVDAARGATFSPTQLAGAPVRVSGVIVYNFVGSMTPGMLGYEIGYAERAGRFAENSFGESLAARLPESWASEKDALKTLSYEPFEQPQAVKDAPKIVAMSADGTKMTIKGSASSGYVSRQLTLDGVEAVKKIGADVDLKLSTSDASQWHFRLGRRLGALVADLADTNKTMINASELETLRVNAPNTISEGTIDRIRELVDLASGPEQGAVRQQAIRSAALSLRNLRLSTSW